MNKFASLVLDYKHWWQWVWVKHLNPIIIGLSQYLCLYNVWLNSTFPSLATMSKVSLTKAPKPQLPIERCPVCVCVCDYNHFIYTVYKGVNTCAKHGCLLNNISILSRKVTMDGNGWKESHVCVLHKLNECCDLPFAVCAITDCMCAHVGVYKIKHHH